MTTHRLLTLAGVVLLAGCPGPISECTGDLTVIVRVPRVPSKLQLRWQGEVVVDECAATSRGALTYEKRATELVINDGGFGYTPPSTVSLEVVDLKDCVQAPELLVAAVDKTIPGGPFAMCSQASLDVQM